LCICPVWPQTKFLSPPPEYLWLQACYTAPRPKKDFLTHSPERRERPQRFSCWPW
jgi:hypothetical protein